MPATEKIEIRQSRRQAIRPIAIRPFPETGDLPFLAALLFAPVLLPEVPDFALLMPLDNAEPMDPSAFPRLEDVFADFASFLSCDSWAANCSVISAAGSAGAETPVLCPQ